MIEVASKLESLVQQIKDGSTTAEKAAPKVADLVKGAPSIPEPGTQEYKDYVLGRLADKDDDGYESSFSVVTAAWIAGDLSDGQYHTLRDAVTEGASADTDGEDEDVATQPAPEGFEPDDA